VVLHPRAGSDRPGKQRKTPSTQETMTGNVVGPPDCPLKELTQQLKETNR
jgi:hypothetical protein